MVQENLGVLWKEPDEKLDSILGDLWVIAGV
jgi:hypothetical protein